MRYRALLAARSPPRERRWRVILPEDAGTEAAPHSAANEASLRSRCGLVPYLRDAFAAECVQELKGYGVQFDVAGV